MIEEINPEIYPRLIWVCVGNEEEALKQLFPKDQIPPLSKNYYAETREVSTKDKSGLLIRFHSKKEMTPDIIAHEAAHVAIKIFNVIDSEISITTSEPFCYLLDYLIKKILKIKSKL